MQRINKLDGKNMYIKCFFLLTITDYVNDCMGSEVRSFPLSTKLILITTDDVYSLILIEFSRQLLFCTADLGRKIESKSKIKESFFLVLCHDPTIQPLSSILHVVR